MFRVGTMSLFLAFIAECWLNTTYAHDWAEQHRDHSQYESRRQLWHEIQANRSFAYDWEEQYQDHSQYEGRRELWYEIIQANRSFTTDETDYGYSLGGIKSPEQKQRELVWQLENHP